MKPLRYPAASVPVESVRPLGDFVLVRPLLEPEQQGQIVLPDSARAPEKGLRRGVVVACGNGDKAVNFCCDDCGANYSSTLRQVGESQVFAVSSCPACGSPGRSMWKLTDGGRLGHGKPFISRRPVHVKPGDVVIYPRVPANGVQIDGEEHFMLHEEQHCWAVEDSNVE